MGQTMFNFLHPQSVGRRRPVAEAVVQQEVRNEIGSHTVLIGRPGRARPKLPRPKGTAPVTPMRIAFSVSYSRAEYLGFVSDHAPTMLAEYYTSRGKPTRPMSRLHEIALTACCSLAFYFKKRAMPVCKFVIDQDGIRRSSAKGDLFVPWAKVGAVHRYSQGYLLAGGKGLIPLPRRCFSDEDVNTLEALLTRRGGNNMPQA